MENEKELLVNKIGGINEDEIFECKKRIIELDQVVAKLNDENRKLEQMKTGNQQYTISQINVI